MVESNMICAGYLGVGGKDACAGDGGGPLVCNHNGNAVIAGITSHGDKCGLPYSPGIYARVTSALSWIQENMVRQQFKSFLSISKYVSFTIFFV